MQTASGHAVQHSPNRTAGSTSSRRARARRFVRHPVTLAVAGVVALLAIGSMLIALFGLWPPGGRTELTGLQHPYHPAVYRNDNGVIVSVTPTSDAAPGLNIEKAGAPRRDGNNVVVPLKVTNNVKVVSPVQTPVPAAKSFFEGLGGWLRDVWAGLGRWLQGKGTSEAPTATVPANVYNGVIKVIFYKTQGGKREVVGSGVGNVLDLPYGQSKQIEVVATAVGDFTDYDAIPDSVWTDKDTVKAP